MIRRSVGNQRVGRKARKGGVGWRIASLFVMLGYWDLLELSEAKGGECEWRMREPLRTGESNPVYEINPICVDLKNSRDWRNAA